MLFPTTIARHGIALTRQEISIISHSISRDFSPRFVASRSGQWKAPILFSPQELQDISRQISREYAPSKISHQSRLVLLAVSPRRLHAYWHVAKQRLNKALSRHEPAPTMTLRIYAEPDSPASLPASADKASKWFDVTVTQADGRQDIWLPEALVALPASGYRAELGEMGDDREFTPQVSSNSAQTSKIVAAETRSELPNAVAQFIMPASHPASSAGKTASGQGK